MINRKSLTLEWIEQVSKANQNTDKILVEKTIRALLLLEGLSSSGLSFIFKGGTALMLLLKTARRLSIDIDIIIAQKPQNLETVLRSFATSQGFNSVELQHRSIDSAIEKAHYKFYYSPILKSNKTEDYILLDILFEENHYLNISLNPIESPFIMIEGDSLSVAMPSFEDLLGDKLTAFAPETTGIPYFKQEVSRSMEIIKQLYDIGNLFDLATNLETIKTTFEAIARTEIVYRNLSGIIPKDVLEEIYQTALCISLRGTAGKCNFDELQKGIKAVERFIFSEHYHLEKAIPHAAKAAYLSRLIDTNQTTFEKFNDPFQVSEAKIEHPHNTRLQKLKKSSPEAFFYWWKATQI
jgi:hypothetical protein